MRFTLRQLQLFVAACETGTVSGAAEREHLSQSAVSSAIAALERSLGMTLLIRHHAHGVVPTPAGRQLLDEARHLLRQATELDRMANELADGVAGQLEVGVFLTLAPLIMPRICRGFSERYPGITLRFTEADQDGLLTRLREGQIAVALTYDLQLTDDIAFERLAILPPMVLCAADHPLASRDAVSLDELAHEPMVLLDLPLSRDYFLALFAAHGLEPRISHRTAQPDVVRSLVANGFGYSLVNARPVANRSLDGKLLVTVSLAGAHRPMHLGVASLRLRREPRLVRVFRDYCRQAIGSDGIPGMTTAGDRAS